MTMVNSGLRGLTHAVARHMFKMPFWVEIILLIFQGRNLTILSWSSTDETDTVEGHGLGERVCESCKGITSTLETTLNLGHIQQLVTITFKLTVQIVLRC